MIEVSQVLELIDIQNLPPTPLQRGNEIVYDSQGVIERTFSRLIDNFYLFQRIYSPSRRG